ncbi:hypothetical protein [Rubinisphaera margarita]|uniref:hypothetical protein n=1 Tax=Rubinisphaera margarita TaxID=2909586 RepID=UPI001EE94C6F|nr:hypothetical protein [Rubinisphaera margarita]MCG6154241.1 hypothetical protein [Rubinisphaera margarita]
MTFAPSDLLPKLAGNPYQEEGRDVDDRDNEHIDRKQTTWNWRMMQIGWTVSISSVVLLIVFVVGLFSGWFWMDGDVTDDSIALTVAVNTDEVAESADAAAEAVTQTGEQVEVLSNSEVIEGTVISVGRSGGDRILNVQPRPDEDDAEKREPSPPWEIVMTSATEFAGDAEAVEDLVNGDKVRVVYRDDDKKKSRFALRVTEGAREEEDREQASTD